MRLNRQVVIWIDAKKDTPKPSLNRFYLISDGKGVSIGKYLGAPGQEWEECLSYAEQYYGFKDRLEEIKYWASLPLSPESEE